MRFYGNQTKIFVLLSLKEVRFNAQGLPRSNANSYRFSVSIMVFNQNSFSVILPVIFSNHFP